MGQYPRKESPSMFLPAFNIKVVFPEVETYWIENAWSHFIPFRSVIFFFTAIIFPYVIDMCIGGGRSLQKSTSPLKSGLSHLIFKGNRFHGPTFNIFERSLTWYWNRLSFFFFGGRWFKRLDRCGFCQAHSNLSAEIILGNPYTIRTITHGPRLLVLRAPPIPHPTNKTKISLKTFNTMRIYTVKV